MAVKVNDGGPAFPQPIAEIQGSATNSADFAVPGMSLRDYFAAQALIAVTIVDTVTRLESDDPEDLGLSPEQIATCAYVQADAMLKAREE